ncbi:MAG: GNAT family N-acetyltransferase [Erysipelotrichaceae bacterium]|nr:GNAT family N-acetyltransferase [Erysipelotrichaceae bacterium]
MQTHEMRCRLPEISDESILQEYVKEHFDNGEKSISASMGLSSSVYSEWVEKIHRNADTGDSTFGRSLLYLCFDEDRLVGLLSIRYELPEELRNKYGDIGYGVRPSQRNKGYATAMLKHALSVCREKGMDKVVIGCFKDNQASAATIKKNGGKLIAENGNYKEGLISQYYLIDIQNTDDGRVIAACGNDCTACPRYVKHPYEKTDEELHHTAELWMKIGYRDCIVTNEEIACTGCKSENRCRYHVIECCSVKGIRTCAECAAYPCERMKECFRITGSFEPLCREVSKGKEYDQLRKAFFEKKENLDMLKKLIEENRK